MIPKKALYVMGIWLIPVVLVLLQAALFLRRASWQSDYIPYSITFWALRALLAPGIVWYTLRFWVEHTKVFKLFLVHAAGFLLFSLLFWGSSFLILHQLLHRSEFFGVVNTATDLHIFGMIVDNSVSANSVVYVSTVGFCYIWEFVRQNVSIHKRAMELEQSLLTSKLELLKGQLNTHFLFNTLHTISSLVVRRQNEEANKMLVRLSDLLRFSLKENKEQLIPLYREMELLQLYLDIQQTRFKDRLQLCVKVDPSVHQVLIPSLLLQPIVENAVKYGVEPYSGRGLVEINIHPVPGALSISVKDNGKKDFGAINFGEGIGLDNTKERLHQLYGGDHKFFIRPNDFGQGVVVTIEIPNKTAAYVP